jgi:hypothetical protein
VKALAPGQAKKLAEKALKEKPEVKALAQALKGKGKKLVLSRAHGCKVKGKAKGQGLSAMQESPDFTLIEVPAGSDAALYLLENETAGEGNYWASLKGTDEGGQWLTHLETAVTSDGSTSPDSVGTNLFLPDAAGTQEITEQVR